MALTECANGHLYDTDMYQTCPYCNGGSNMINFGAGDSGIGKTVGSINPAGDSEIGKTVGAPSMMPSASSEVGATVAPAGYRGKKEEDSESDDTGKTVAMIKKSTNIDPVVGWLVCIAGVEKGRDYRIYGKNNTIGRSDKNDIVMKGDTTISRENHARIGFDPKHNNFHLIPGESTNVLYVNEEPIYVPTVLKDRDIIELGESKFIFVPLCNEKFNWQDQKDEKTGE